MKFLTLISLAILIPNFAHATDVDTIEKSWNTCLESDEGQSTQGMIGCNLEAYGAADTELNRFYKKTVGELKRDKETGKEVLARLVAAQRAWITFRDSNCNLQGISMLGGTGENVIISGCQASTVIKRVKELEELFAGE